MLNMSYPLQDHLSPSCILPIMVYLSPADLVRAREVSQIWRNFIDREFGPDLSAIRISAEGLPMNGILGEYSCYHLSLSDNQEVISVGRNISDRGFAHLMQRMPQGIRAVNIVDSDNLTARSFHELALRLGKVLIELKIWNCEKLTGGDLSISLGLCTELTSLSIRHCSQLSGTQFRPLMQSLPKSVKTFELVDCPKLKPRDFSSFNHASQLTRLTIQRCAGLTDQAFGATIGCLPALTSLDLRENSSLTNNLTRYIAQSNLELHELILIDRGHLTLQTLNHLSTWPNRSSLKTLYVEAGSIVEMVGCKIGKQNLPLESLVIPPETRIIEILDYGIIKDSSSANLIGQKLPKELLALHLGDSLMNSEGLSTLAPYLPATLEFLNVKSCEITLEGWVALVRHFPKGLRHLELSGWYRKEALEFIVSHLPQGLLSFNINGLNGPSLITLGPGLPHDLSRLNLTDVKGLKDELLCKFIPYLPKKLTCLQLGASRDGGISEAGLAKLASHLSPTLVYLELSGYQGTDNSGIIALAKSIPKGLLSLTLKYFKGFNDLGIFSLAKNLPSGLESFYLSDCDGLSKDQLTILSRYLPKGLKNLALRNCYLNAFPLILPPDLVILDLSYSSIQMSDVAPYLPPHLKGLDMYRCKFIDTEGIKLLASNMPSGLTHLSLNECQGLDLEGLSHLAKALPDTLEVLDLRWTKLTNIGQDLIREKFPKVLL